MLKIVELFQTNYSKKWGWQQLPSLQKGVVAYAQPRWFSIMCCAGRVWVFAGFIAAPQPIMLASESGFLLVFWSLTSRSGEGP